MKDFKYPKIGHFQIGNKKFSIGNLKNIKWQILQISKIRDLN